MRDGCAIADAGVVGWFRANEKILAICGSTFLVMTGQGITSPILPLYARSFGVSTAVVGLTITVFALARLLLNLPAGALADRRGRRMLLIGGPLVLAAGMIGAGTATSIWILLIWRFVAGAGSALYMTGAQLYILDISPADRRGRNLSYNSGALLAGVALGPAVGGIVAELTNFRVPFFLVGGFAIAAAIYSYVRLEETLSQDTIDERAAKPAPSGRPSFIGPTFFSLCFISAAMFATRAGTRATLVPLLAIDEFGLSEGELGVILGSTGLVGIALIGPAGQVADRFRRKATIVPTGVIACLGTLAIVVSPSVGWLWASLFFLAFGTTLTGPAQYAFLADLATEQERGRALGLYRSAGDAGFLIAPPLLGWLADSTSIDTAMTFNAGVVGLAALGVLIIAVEPQREAIVERRQDPTG